MLFKKKIKAYTSIGCFSTSGGTGCLNDVFNENCSDVKCSNESLTYSLEFNLDDCGYLLSSSESMTVEMCLKICSANKLRYAGLTL